MTDVVIGSKEASKEEEKARKGKCKHIACITEGVPQENYPSKGTMKPKIVELMALSKKGEGTSTKSPKMPMLGFQDSEKVEGIWKKNVLVGHNRHDRPF